MWTTRAGHRQWKKWTTANTDKQQPTHDNRHPTTRNQQQSPTTTADKQQPTFDNRQSTTSNKQQSATATPTINTYHSTTDSRQPASNNNQRQLHRQTTAENQQQARATDSYTPHAYTHQTTTNNRSAAQRYQIIIHMGNNTWEQVIISFLLLW